MKLVSLKRDAKDKKDEAERCSAPCAVSDQPDYPWGTCITLGEDELEKIGMSTLPMAGALAVVEAQAVVKSVREETVDGKVVRSLELQLTDIAVAAAGGRSAAEKLYDKKD